MQYNLIDENNLLKEYTFKLFVYNLGGKSFSS